MALTFLACGTLQYLAEALYPVSHFCELIAFPHFPFQLSRRFSFVSKR